jgi:hypothetical protein
VFAGAAREAVFSRPDVIRRVNADFVPVALKAALVNNPGDDEEGRLYREIGRSRPAPQGICVANSAGKVLTWVLMLDDDKSVLAFLDHTLMRFRESPDARRPVVAERYMKFPSVKLVELRDNGETPLIPERHAAGKRCPAKPPLRQGTLVARLFGRALGLDGKPVADTVHQEQYVEDRFHVPVDGQKLLAKALSDAGASRFPLPRALARLLVSHAYLGQLDVNPLGSPAGGEGDLKQCELWAQRVSVEGSKPTRLRIEGTSEVAGGQETRHPDPGSDGRFWQHEVKLAWEGYMELQGSRLTRLLLLARGSERLRWGNSSFRGEADVARLPGGHPIDLACGVRYGIVGEPAGPGEVGGDALP